MNSQPLLAPELHISQWLNASQPITLSGLRGRVVALHVFQMLCPGCVSHGLPQATAIREAFPESELAVLGLHSVFEHHDVMTPEALRVFLYEYRISFPVGIDQASLNSPIPMTMQTYGMRGTPTLILLDRQGHVRLNHFGQLDDLRVGAMLGRLLNETEAPNIKTETVDRKHPLPEGGCDDEGCSLDHLQERKNR